MVTGPSLIRLVVHYWCVCSSEVCLSVVRHWSLSRVSDGSVCSGGGDWSIRVLGSSTVPFAPNVGKVVTTVRIYHNIRQNNDFFCAICSDKQPTHVVRVYYSTSYLWVVLDFYEHD